MKSPSSNSIRDAFRYGVSYPLLYALDRLKARLRHKNPGDPVLTRVLLASDGLAYTSEEQFNLFQACRSDLRDRMNVIFTRVPIEDLIKRGARLAQRFDIVVIKLSFATAPTQALNLVKSINQILERQSLVYFDGDDDLCVQWPDVLNYVDLYVKKHLFKDREYYRKTFVGKSNLTDFVHVHHGHTFSENSIAAKTGGLTPREISKLALGVNLASDQVVLNLYRKQRELPRLTERPIDVIFRGSVPNNWMGALRREVPELLSRLGKDYHVVVPTQHVARNQYYEELRSSSVCISPFGYGEICWRDFEAVLCGALLLKPDMSHVETRPNIFVPFETYVPVKWDFSDLIEKCTFYLNHESQRIAIAKRAHKVLADFYEGEGMTKAIMSLLEQAKYEHRDETPLVPVDS